MCWFSSETKSAPTTLKRKAACVPMPPQSGPAVSNASPAGDEQGPTSEEAEVAALGPDHCPYCFLAPCIAQSNGDAHWVGNGNPPSDENSAIRRRIYSRFWKCIANMGGWNLAQYQAKKIRIGGGDWVVQHQREVMPECVITLARNKYPNPKHRPYMGHMWQ